MLFDWYSIGRIPKIRPPRSAGGRSSPFLTANRRIVNLQ